jgi:aryl-alcohol dehydrogenase-like predicted oxidoreductase
MLKKADEMGFAFDTAQMPLNVFDHHFESFEKKVLPVLVQKNMGVLGMKPLAAGAILKTGVVNATQCLHYAMNLQTSVVITGCDSMGVLEQALAAAYSFKPLPEDQLASLLQSTAALAQGGKHERFKTSQDFDGTEQNPHWLTTSEV